MELNNGTFLRSRIQWAVLACGAVAMLSAGGATAKQSIRIADERAFFEQLDLDRTELAGVKKVVKAEDWDAAKEAWSKHLQERTSPKWLWSWRDKKKIKALYEKNVNGLKKSPGQADKVLRREFRFGGVTRTLPHDIDWDRNDYTKEWRNVLNRHRTWITLGHAWWQTGDSKYPEDWVYMLRDWIKDNPVDAGGRPWRSLEVGARANIWPEVMNLFMEAPAFDAEARYLLTRSMVEHARFLYRNNAHFKKGNWQTTEAQGLASIGIMLPEFKESKAWRERAFSLMSTHMKKGVFPDGLTHQRSVLFVKPDYWVVVDHVSGKPTAELTRLFHLPVVEVKRGEHSVQTQFKDGQNLWIGHADTARLEMRKGLVRASVKTDVKAPVAALVSKHEQHPTVLCTVLVPFATTDEIPTLERVKSADPNHVSIKVRFKDGRTDWIAVAPNNADLSAGKHKGKGMALCVRSQAGETTVDALQTEPVRRKK